MTIHISMSSVDKYLKHKQGVKEKSCASLPFAKCLSVVLLTDHLAYQVDGIAREDHTLPSILNVLFLSVELGMFAHLGKVFPGYRNRKTI